MSTCVETAVAEIERLDLDSVRLDPKWALRVPATYALRKRILPLCEIKSVVMVACSSTPDNQTRLSLEKHLGKSLQWVASDESALDRALQRVYQQMPLRASNESKAAIGPARDVADDAVSVCDELFQAAVLRSASDIHLIPNERGLSVHLRVDGLLELYRELGKHLQPFVVSRLKVLAGMDIAEKRTAQDGHITTFIGTQGRRLEVRAACLPTRYGERVTLRLLGNSSTDLTLQSLGMSPDHVTRFSTASQSPHGLILLTGPTGSGKSTTLFVAIQRLLAEHGVNVITVEDPIEYEIQGASQVEVDTADKVNFSKALRGILRHDPDVLMIGEIRDHETADTAIKAALTGHLVFSTLHTNTAAGVVTRLIDMGVQPFLVAATLRLSVAQRLVRKLCPVCRRQRTIDREDMMQLGRPQLQGRHCYEPVGCVHCAGKGFSGRVGLFEMLECSSDTSKLIANGADETLLAEHTRRLGEGSLLEDGIAKVLDGTTTISEISSAVAKG